MQHGQVFNYRFGQLCVRYKTDPPVGTEEGASDRVTRATRSLAEIDQLLCLGGLSNCDLPCR